MIDDLLDLATTLADRGTNRGRPRQVELRRATSTAYYALFHAIAKLCAQELVGWSKPRAVVSPMYRSVDHRRTRDVLHGYRKEAPGSSVAQISIVFAALQEARHEADYDPGPFKLKRSGTIDLVNSARQAVMLLNGLAPEARLALAVKLIARHR